MANIGYLNGGTSGGTFTQSDLGLTAVNFQQRTQTKITQTQSGRTVRASNSTTLWAGTLQFPPDTQFRYRGVQAFFAKARGPLNDFYVIIPGVSNFLGKLASSNVAFTVNTSASAGSTSISVAASGSVVTGTWIPAGSVVKFASHDKVYMVTNDVYWTNASAKTMTIEPPLVSSITSSNVITHDDVPFKVFATSDLHEYQYTNNGLVAYRVDVQETI